MDLLPVSLFTTLLSLFIFISHSFLSFGSSGNLKVLTLDLESFLQLIAAQKTMLFCSKPAKLTPSHASRNNLEFPALSVLVNSDVTNLILRQLCRALHDHQGPKSALFHVQYLSKAVFDYSETSGNVYLAFNQHIRRKNKKIENLVHLTFNVLNI